MATFDFFTDTLLTTPAPSPLQVSHNSDFSDNPQDFQFFLGSLGASLKIEANSNPGVDNIIISVVDSDPGNNHEDTEIKLATSEAAQVPEEKTESELLPEADKEKIITKVEDTLTIAVKEILWEIVPPLAEKIIKEEIQKIKSEIDSSSE